MIIIIITIVLILIAAEANSVMDKSSENRFSNPKYNKTTSSGNKWKNGDPEQGERFFLSSTVLVGFTDLWHFSQLIFHSSWQLAIAIQTDYILIYFLSIKTIFSLMFEMSYRKGKK